MALSTESSLSVTFHCDRHGAVLMVPRGELDADTLMTFDYCIDDALHSTRTKLCVDLSGISFIDFTGYREIVQVGERCRRRGIANAWISPSDSVRAAFRVFGPPLGDVALAPSAGR
jgi:anti-anti-sigma factor